MLDPKTLTFLRPKLHDEESAWLTQLLDLADKAIEPSPDEQHNEEPQLAA